MANILYLDNYAGSAEHGRSFRPYYLGTEWLKKGHKVFVVAGTFSHLRNKQPAFPSVENIEGITYIWLATPKYKGNGVKRAYSMLIFMLQLFFNLKKIIKIANPDVIIASSVHMLDIYPAWLMKKLIKKKVSLVFELHDLWPLTLIQIGNISKYNPFVMFLAITEKFLYRNIDQVVSILPNTLPYMNKFGISDSQFCHIPNGIVLDEWTTNNPLPVIQQKIIDDLKKKGKFLVGYAGTYSIANCLYNLLDAAYLCQQKGCDNVHFLLIGNGPEKENIIHLAKEREMENISFLDIIPKSCIPSFLKQMDILYFGLMDKPIYEYGISLNKIFDYMMAGRPLLQAVSRGNDIVEREKCGINVPSNSPDLLCDAILKLRNYPKNILSEIGLRGKKYVLQHHNYQQLANSFSIFICKHLYESTK